ncbi:MAG: conjugal transfer protein TraF [Deltaproteobacteria bacterium]|nr:conjugal transfer protein TraF [Deltaproteobacteria bacterium]MBZ0219406.1 conjugal transfer protein TraF [Deltaproteobacteria bacterium]
MNIGPVDNFDLNDFTNPGNYSCGGCDGTVDNLVLTPAQEAELDTFLQGLGWDATQRSNFIEIADQGLSLAPPGEVPDDIVEQIKTLASVADTAAGSGGNTIDENESALLVRGIGVAEVPLTYGRKINDDFSVGGNVKFMKARVYNARVEVFDKDVSDVLDEAKEDYTESNAFGVDLGALYRFGDKLRFGVVARNVNSPKFDMKPISGDPADSIKEKAQVRAGVAYKPFDFLTLAADIDVTENETAAANGLKSRNLGGGVEASIFNFLKLRAGIYKNLSMDDIGPVYTAGLGLNLWLFNIDLGGAVSSGTTTVDGDEIPKEARAELAISALF